MRSKGNVKYIINMQHHIEQKTCISQRNMSYEQIIHSTYSQQYLVIVHQPRLLPLRIAVDNLIAQRLDIRGSHTKDNSPRNHCQKRTSQILVRNFENATRNSPGKNMFIPRGTWQKICIFFSKYLTKSQFGCTHTRKNQRYADGATFFEGRLWHFLGLVLIQSSE